MLLPKYLSLTASRCDSGPMVAVRCELLRFNTLVLGIFNGVFSSPFSRMNPTTLMIPDMVVLRIGPGKSSKIPSDYFSSSNFPLFNKVMNEYMHRLP